MLLERTFAERRALLEGLVPAASVELCPQVRTAVEAERWLHEYEGVIAKRLDAPYLPGERKGMQKVRRQRTLDCVVAGYRPGKAEGTIGSLMLGVYDTAGKLVVIGHSSGFSAKEKRELLERLRPLETGERGTAEPSRWTAGRDLEWVALEPVLVVEVTYDHASDGRIRPWRERRSLAHRSRSVELPARAARHLARWCVWLVGGDRASGSSVKVGCSPVPLVWMCWSCSSLWWRGQRLMRLSSSVSPSCSLGTRWCAWSSRAALQPGYWQWSERLYRARFWA